MSVSRRIIPNSAAALAILACALSFGAESVIAQTAASARGDATPRFRADGPDASAYDSSEGYPSCTALTYIREQRCRVGAFSHFDALFPARTVAAPTSPSPLRRATNEPSIRYSFNGQERTLDQYLDAHPVTGFLIAKDDAILVERYQYARTDKHRLTSFSMAKTIVGLLIGIAVKDGAIRSIDDLAEDYESGLKGTEYGRTPIKALLGMTSGVAFQENYIDATSDIAVLAGLTLGHDAGGSLSAVKRFDTRVAKPGERFSYASAESLVLGLVLAGATRRNVSGYASEKLWQPLGAEADAAWVIDATGQEITFAFFNAVLRDWARLGLMLAHDGLWQGKRIVPREWLLTSTEPGSPFPGYGYQVWLPSAKRRTLALRGVRGQFVPVDPEAKLVLVQTSVREISDSRRDEELLALWSALSSQLR